MGPILPEAVDTVQWPHRILSRPLRWLADRGIGPLGGDNSISAVIEAVIAQKRGNPPSYPLSKSDQFFVNQLTANEIPDPMLEYRELSHAAQEEILRLRQSDPISVIWLGAGVFTLSHPLLRHRVKGDCHLWTDKSPKVVQEAMQAFDELQVFGRTGNLSYDITLPHHVDRLNYWLDILCRKVEQVIISCYGVSYALTMEENYAWLSKLALPREREYFFIFNAPGPSLPLLPGIMASFHGQRMVYYERRHIEALFAAAVPDTEIVWEMPRELTRNKMWATWILRKRT